MKCEICGNIMAVKNNPKYKLPNYEHETHLVIECDYCKKREIK